jgi:selenocysteine lyase/cysteine desulfurase
LNTSHQGALPKTAVAALQEAIKWKISPLPLAVSDLFSQVPQSLRKALGKLINAPSEDIILGNSASYGLHLLANGTKWSGGDEILLVEGDFPCNILPWLNLRKLGVNIRIIKPKGEGLQPEDISANLGNSTRLLCLSWVFSFTGFKIDLPAISKICHEHGVKVVLNCSQALGNQPFDLTSGYVDALTCVGHKWLCGPYGTGFCWIDPEFREELDYNQAYWLAMQTADDLKNPRAVPEIKEDLGARKYDVFGTANFFNFVPLTASVEFINEIGIKRIKIHNDKLIKHLRENLDKDKYDIVTPLNWVDPSSILVISHKDKNKNKDIFDRLIQKDIIISLRHGNLRMAPHLYNTEADIDRTLSVLNST